MNKYPKKYNKLLGLLFELKNNLDDDSVCKRLEAHLISMNDNYAASVNAIYTEAARLEAGLQLLTNVFLDSGTGLKLDVPAINKQLSKILKCVDTLDDFFPDSLPEVY